MEDDVTSTAPWVLLFGVSVYGVALIGIVILVRAVVRISQTLNRIGQSLEEIAAEMKAGTARQPR